MPHYFTNADGPVSLLLPHQVAVSMPAGLLAAGMAAMIDLVKSEEWHANRRRGIGGSDAPRIMRGEWQELWLEKTGRVKPRKIMSDWDYYFRICSETIQLDWFQHRTGRLVSRRDESVISTVFPFIRATLDGIIDDSGEPINAKHLSSWTKDARTWAVDHYYWQIIHEIVVLRPSTLRGYISLIVGEKEPEIIPIEADPISLDALIDAETNFWEYVITDTPPDPAYQPNVPAIAWDTMRAVDLSHSNSWISAAIEWQDTRAAAKQHADAAAGLKALIEPDVREAMGGGVIATRARNGAITIREHKDTQS